MPTLNSSILFLGCGQSSADTFGAQIVISKNEFYSIISIENASEKIMCIVVNLSYLENENPTDFIKKARSQLPHAQIVLLDSQQNSEALREIINTGNIFKITDSTESPDFEQSIREAVEAAELSRQKTALFQLFNEQTLKLQVLQKDLEDRVEKRQAHLLQSNEKLVITNRRMEGFHKAVLEIQKAKSIREIEKKVKDSLEQSISVSAIKISYQTSGLPSPLDKTQGHYTVPLTRASRPVGSVTYLSEIPFTKTEVEFLHQISEAITIAIDRLAKFEEAEIIKQQWQDTFDAITESVVIISTDHLIIRSNRSFAKLSSKSEAAVIGQKCYKVFFNRNSPCEECQLGKRFNLTLKKTMSGSIQTFAVSSQPVNSHGNGVYINIYRDITEKQRLERRLLESAKMAELGTIGGSIAHELNNPIAGMLTFAQLIRSDLKGGEWYYEDIIEIENGIIRCRDIIRDLLGFTRKPSLDEREAVDVYESLQQAIKIIELQSKPLGIKIRIKSNLKNKYNISGHSNLLTQALVNILQDSLNNIKEAFNKGNRSIDTITIQLDATSDKVTIDFFDTQASSQNTLGMKSLGLTVANQIIEEHGGSLDRTENPRPTDSPEYLNQAKISLPRLVFDT